MIAIPKKRKRKFTTKHQELFVTAMLPQFIASSYSPITVCLTRSATLSRGSLPAW